MQRAPASDVGRTEVTTFLALLAALLAGVSLGIAGVFVIAYLMHRWRERRNER